MRGASAPKPKPEQRKSTGVIYLCPDCTGTINIKGIQWKYSRPHPEREATQAATSLNQDIKHRIQFLLEQGKSHSEITALIWQTQSTSTEVS